MQRAQAIRRLTQDTSAATVNQQADLLKRRVELEAMRARANAMADRSISALSATQAVAQQARVTGQILTNIEKLNSDIALNLANKAMLEQSEREIARAQIIHDNEARAALILQGAGTMKQDPITWGR